MTYTIQTAHNKLIGYFEVITLYITPVPVGHSRKLQGKLSQGAKPKIMFL